MTDKETEIKGALQELRKKRMKTYKTQNDAKSAVAGKKFVPSKDYLQVFATQKESTKEEKTAVNSEQNQLEHQ